eukprot:COSAG01_NODE_25857_length_731_cov_0.922468_1_plen_22_part_01
MPLLGSEERRQLSRGVSRLGRA